MEHELRQEIPIFFYHVWDNSPYPFYNKSYYLSCDWIGCISKQTYNIVKNVAPELQDWQVTYIPHGIDETIFYPIEENSDKMVENKDKKLVSEYEHFLEYKQNLIKKEYDFIVLFNNRNIRRKNVGDVILAYKEFCDTLPKEQAEKCLLLLHTQLVDMNGTDVGAVINAICPNYSVIINDNKIPPNELNYIYNMADVTINIASAEGFGLATAESLMAGTPIIANVTGGMQDQMGFKNSEGKFIEFSKDWPTNADGRIKHPHGEWVYPVFPSARSLVGSPPTPYIFDDRVSISDVVEALKYWHSKPRKERKELGKKGREYMQLKEVGMTAEEMSNRFIRDMEIAWDKWVPRNRYQLIKV
jgi:glycosyltransferase involved in cell wall biosynthesis